MGQGLQRITKLYGSIEVQGKRFVWDYVADEAVPEAEMPVGSERHAASEKARWERVRGCVTSQNSEKE